MPWPLSIPAFSAANSPADDLLVLRSDEVFLLRRQYAEGELLPGPAFPVHDIRTLVHVDGALGQGGWLEGRMEAGKL